MYGDFLKTISRYVPFLLGYPSGFNKISLIALSMNSTNSQPYFLLCFFPLISFVLATF